MATLFLACAADDHERASALAAGLRSAGHLVRTDPHLTGDAGWWSGILTAIQETDAFLYATPPATPSVSETRPGAPADREAVTRERAYAEALGIPTLAIHLSGAGEATGVDFREPGADAAFHLIGAIASLPPRPATIGWQPAPESPFAESSDPTRAEQALSPDGPRVGAEGTEQAFRRAGPEGAEQASPRAGAEGAEQALSSAGVGGEAFSAAAARRRAEGESGALSGSEGSESRAGAKKGAFSKWAAPSFLTADEVRQVGFRKPPLGRRGYDEESVDQFLDQVESDLRARQEGGPVIRVVMTAADVHTMAFGRPPFGRRGYDEEQVDQFLDDIQRTLTALDRDLTARGAKVAKA